MASSGATLLAVAFGLWGLHHLDYPFLRARGAWAPWGYYLDILLALAVGAGILLLVLDDLRRGLGALSALSGDLQRAGREQDVLAALLARPLTLPAVRGSALYLLRGRPAASGARRRRLRAADEPDARRRRRRGARARARDRAAAGQRRLARDRARRPFPYAAVLPLFRREEVIGALVLVGDARDPFTALDDRFLVALGQQVGAALENADLYSRLEARTVELARLSARMIEQHEEERRRLSRELHDETAQVFSAVKMELGVLRDGVGPGQADRLDQVLGADRHRHPEHPERHQRPAPFAAGRPRPAPGAPLAGGRLRRAERHPDRARGSRGAAAALQGGRAGAVPRAAGGAVQRAAGTPTPARVDIGISVERRRACCSRCATTAAASRPSAARAARARGPHGAGGHAGADQRARRQRPLRRPRRGAAPRSRSASRPTPAADP